MNYSRLLSRPVVLVTMSVAVGAVLLWVLFQLGPETITADSRDSEPDIENLVRSGSTTGSSGNLDKNAVILDSGGKIQTGDMLGVRTDGIVIESEGQDGKLAQRYFWDHQEPIAGGWHIITNPKAHLYISDTQLVVITADKAQVRLVGQQPQAGSLVGNVVFALYESDDVYQIESVDNLQPTIIGNAETVRFDQNLNILEVEDRITAKSGSWAFAGKGLSLVYNSQYQRIDNLTLNEREYILLRPDGQLFSSGGQRQESSAVIANADAVDAGSSVNSTPASEINKPAGDGALTSATQLQSGDVVENKTDLAAAQGNQANENVTPHNSDIPVLAQEGDYYLLELGGQVIVARGLAEEEITFSGNNMTINFAITKSLLSGMMTSNQDSPSIEKSYQFPQVPAYTNNNPTANKLVQSWQPAIWLASSALAVVQQEASASSLDDTMIPQLLSSDSTRLDNDILITGKGPLSLRSLAEKPDAVSSDEDVCMEMTGTPVWLETPDGDAVSSKLIYKRADNLIKLVPNDVQPLEIRLPEQSVLSSSKSSMIINLDESSNVKSARIDGQGRFDTGNRQSLSPGATPSATEIGDVLRIYWSSGLDIIFEPVIGGGMDINRESARLKSTVFTGDVRVDHSQGLNLLAQKLTANFEGEDQNNNPALTSIIAQEEVSARTSEVELSGADELQVFLHTGTSNSDPVPESAVASGRVAVTDTEKTMISNYVRVHFTDNETKSAQNNESDVNSISNNADKSDLLINGGDLEIDHVLATGNVFLDLSDNCLAYADQLEAFPQEDKAVLTGQTVKISKDTALLLGREVHLLQTENADGRIVPLARVIGEGMAAYIQLSDDAKRNSNKKVFGIDEQLRMIEKRLNADYEKTRDQDADVTPPAAEGSNKNFNNSDTETEYNQNMPDDRFPSASETDKNGNAQLALLQKSLQDELTELNTGIVRFNWAEGATYTVTDDSLIQVNFKGAVTAEYSPRAEEYNLIKAEDLEFKLVDISDINQADDKHISSDTISEADLRLYSMTATGTVENPASIESSKYADAARTLPISRVSIWSVIMEYYDNLSLFTTVGDGSMLVVDNTPDDNNNGDENKKAGDDNPDGTGLALFDNKPVESVVDISGKGNTLFQWTGKMVLDGGHGQMHINDDVIVIHQPWQKEQSISMYCQKLDAELESSVGINALEFSSREGMALHSALAQDSIYIDTGDKTIQADRLEYDGKRKNIILEAFGDNLVSVVEKTSAFPFEAARMVWDLTTDSIRGENVKSITMPRK